MKYQKVVWYEGMKLDPHHFQQTDKYHQYYSNQRIHSINYNFWGLEEIQIDNAALAGGTFEVVKCKGIMEDGLLINMPENDPLPKSRKFEELFSATAEKLDVFLTIPTEKITGKNCSLDGSGESLNTRFILQNSDIPDQNEAGSIRTISIMKPNFHFKFGDESLEDFTAIKIAEISRTSDGKFILDKNYIPPSLSISASQGLLEYARVVLSTLITKAKEYRNPGILHKPELSIAQIEILLMLQSINTYIPLLNYYYTSGKVHPETLYTLFLNLAGQLSSLTNLGLKAADLPIYDHKHLNEIFSQISDEINKMLNVTITPPKGRDVAVPLRRQGDTLFIGQLNSNYIQSQFFVVVSGDLPEKKIISELPRNIRISAYEEIFAVQQAGILGVTVEYVARPPVGITINNDAHYFKINKEGRFWEKIVSKLNIAFFIAAEFKSLQLELVLLLPGD